MDSSLAVMIMTTARFLIVFVGLCAGILMIMHPTVEAGLRINGLVAVINPLILALINLTGISGMAGKTPVYRLALVAAGALLIVIGTI